MKKYLMVIYLAVMCLCMGVPVSAAQYSFAYSSAAVKTGTTSEIYIYKERVNRILKPLNGVLRMRRRFRLQMEK